MNPSPVTGARGAPLGNMPSSLGPEGEPPLKDVLVDLWQNLERLIRQEITLASAELDVKAKRLERELVAAAAGAGLMLAGVLSLVAGVILILALFMPAWIAALITGLVATVVGFALIKAKKPTLADVTPERTIHSLKKDVRTFTESTK